MKDKRLFFVQLLIFIVTLILVLCGIFNFVFGVDNQQCSMTYMLDYPNFKRHYPRVNTSVQGEWYGLYHYSEGDNDVILKGVPVLFVPGNSGSYKQVRSLASVSRQFSLKHGDGTQSFDYFSVHLNEELSALSASIIHRQVAYVDACLTYIASLYGDNRSIIIISHSMGGVVARAVVAKARHTVSMIVALASPLEIPVAGLDQAMMRLYHEINDLWATSERVQDIVLISLTGGNRDILVWDGYGHVTSAKYSMWLPAFSVAGVFVSTDHLSIAWCREFIIALNKALYKSLALGYNPLPSTLLSTMREHLQPKLPMNRDINITIDRYYSLLFRSVVIDIPATDTHYYQVSLPALASPSRPLRLKIVVSDCNQLSGTKSVLVTAHNGHIHTFNTQHEPTLLSLAGGPRTHTSPQLHIHLTHKCTYSIIVYASIFDWAAQLIRIHMGRVPSFVAALIIILPHTHTRPHAVLSVVLLLVTVWLSSYSDLYTDITAMHTYTSIDMADVVMILSMCVPLVWLILLISSAITTMFGLVSSLPLSLLLLALLPVIVLLEVTCQSLAYIPILLLHLLTLPRSTTLSSLSREDHRLQRSKTVTAVIIITFLLELAPLLAEYHSHIQHDNVVSIVRHALTTLTSLAGYGVPRLTVMIATMVVAVRIIEAHQSRVASTSLVDMSLWLTMVSLASCCVIFGAIDSCMCGSYMMVAMLLLEGFTLLRDVSTK